MMTSLWIEAGALTAALLNAVAAVLVMVLHVVPTGVDAREDGVSAYALTPFGDLYRAQVIATGVAASLLIFALIAGGFEPGGGALVLALFAVSRILIARYPTDPRGTTRFSRAGRIHIFLAATTFVTIAVSAPWISCAVTANADWHGSTGVVVALGWTTTILALGTFASSSLPVTRHVFGLVERGAYTAWMLWILVIAVSISGLV